jgi:hypothetical protein
MLFIDPVKIFCIGRFHCAKLLNDGWAWWLTLVIPAIVEVDTERLWFNASPSKKVSKTLYVVYISVPSVEF